MAKGGFRGGRRYNGAKVYVPPKKQWVAIDGTLFDSPEEAEAHSAKGAYKVLHNMKESHIEAILDGTDTVRIGVIRKLYHKLERDRVNSPDYVPRPRRSRSENVVTEGAEGEYAAE